MRLTSHTVDKVRRTIITATGDPWIDIGGDLGHGTRYISRTRQRVGYGGPGAAEALSYLYGVAIARGVDLTKHEETYAYLRTSGRFQPDAQQRGQNDAERRLSPADVEHDNGNV